MDGPLWPTYYDEDCAKFTRETFGIGLFMRLGGYK